MTPAAVSSRPRANTARGQIIPRQRIGPSGEPTWLVRVFLGRDGKGRRRYHSARVIGPRREAQRALTELLRQMDEGRLRQPTRATVGDYLNRWLDEAKARSARLRTRESYREVFRRYILPDLGTVRLLDLTALDVQRVVNNLEGRKLSPRTIRYSIGLLRSALRQAVAWGLLPRNPIAERETLALPQQRKREAKYLTAEQARALLTGTAEERDGPLWRVLASIRRPTW